MGVANRHSIAWGIAQALHAAGAELAFTYQGAAFGKRVLPMVEKLGSKIVRRSRRRERSESRSGCSRR
jgi:enoyl-[acyl-carrier protein] reductase I